MAKTVEWVGKDKKQSLVHRVSDYDRFRTACAAKIGKTPTFGSSQRPAEGVKGRECLKCWSKG
jgi:hypothetical protein